MWNALEDSTTTASSTVAVLIISNKLICLPTNRSLHPTFVRNCPRRKSRQCRNEEDHSDGWQIVHEGTIDGRSINKRRHELWWKKDGIDAASTRDRFGGSKRSITRKVSTEDRLDAEGLKEGIGCMPMDGTKWTWFVRYSVREEEDDPCVRSSEEFRLGADDKRRASIGSMRVNKKSELTKKERR